ncbi:calcium-dependent kinase [Raphidocelis subcapitata]|uniref:Calcium-dependent kinase n=1 Tax=Raphidocelis subcapitata TaxID=307507 RepID=A0A2V0NSZ2_9CHLO|nr:calcium-dependent kinase [Raphidocelis subcapitata]|eukprot:GBF87955.1 calcium-dependent kinase [Raphidocelis subcapitata]
MATATATAAPPAAAAPFSVANVLGKPPGAAKLDEEYDMGRQLGKGAFGVVHLAKQKQKPHEKVAVKTISKARLVCPEDVDDGEINILNLVGGHKNVVSLKSTHEDPASVYLVMELCEGGELFDAIVSAGHLTEKDAARFFRSMVEVIKHCHELGVMHRDLKPENFLLTDKGTDVELKLADFGLSAFFKPGQRMKHLVGSPYYVAPEVLRKDYNQAADMWSLGVILYILLCGLPPFWGNTEEQIFGMVLKGKVDFSVEPWPRISDAAKDCVSRMLTMDATKRPTAQEILQHEWLVKEGVATDVPLGNVTHKLKKMALMAVGQSLAPDELAGLQQLFQSFDADNSGTVTVDELWSALKAWGHKIHEDDLKALVSLSDVSGDGLIDYNEFVAATMHVSKLEKEELLVKAFQDLDQDGSGTIGPEELEEALRRFGIYDDAKELIASADTNQARLGRCWGDEA